MNMPFTPRVSGAICWLLIILVSMCVLSLSCDTGEETTAPESDILSDAVILPKQDRTPEFTDAPSQINLISENISTDFPRSITFNIDVRSSHQITTLELEYTIKKVLRPPVTATGIPDFKRGAEVKTGWTWDTRKATLPPGTEIQYRWIVENEAGDRFETDSSSVVFEDDRYHWSEISDGKIRLFWYKGGESFGQELMESARKALIKLAESAGAELESEVRIYVYASNQDLHDALVYPDEWTGGMAFTQHGVIATGISTGDLEWGKRVITHELSHMVIYQVTYSPLSNVPAWLDEGLATFAEGELRPNFERALRTAVASDSLFSIPSISGSFPAGYSQAELAYAQSYSLVRFLLDRYGSAKMRQLLQEFSNGVRLDDALLETYGLNSEQLEEYWRSSLTGNL